MIQKLGQDADTTWLEEKDKHAALCLSFFVSTVSAMRLSFATQAPCAVRKHKGLTLTWLIQKQEEELCFKERTEDEEAEIAKNIFRTEPGSIAGREDFGSDTKALRHQPLWTDETKEAVTQELKTRLAAYLPETTVDKVSPIVGIIDGTLPAMGVRLKNGNTTVLETVLS